MNSKFKMAISLKVNKLIAKLKEIALTSNRPKHFIYGLLVAFFCTFAATIGVASALEFKDVQYGNKWDWWDWTFTVTGGLIGQILQILVLNLIIKIS